MTNADKMRELVSEPDTSDEQIANWMYMNRICVIDLPDEPEFHPLASSVAAFEQSPGDCGDEMRNVKTFLKMEYVEVKP